MKMSQAFPSKYIKEADLNGAECNVQIERVEVEDVSGDGSESKPVCYFAGSDRGLVLNKTNANAIVNLYGDDTDGWQGKWITLFPTQTDFQGRQVACIRVELHAPEAAAPEAAAPKPAPAAAGNSIPF